MQWLFLFIGASLAAIANENPFAGGFFGFLLGHYISVQSRFKDLELQLSALQRKLSQLNPLQTASSKTNDKATESAQKPTVETPVPKQAEYEQASTFKPQQVSKTSLEISTPEPAATADKKLNVKDQLPKTESTATNSGYPAIEQFESTAIGKLSQLVWNWFTDGNTFVRVGIVILFIGVSFLLRFAVGKGFIPIELRLSAVIAFALFLLSVGWKLREKRTGYSLLIQGGAVGLLYLTIFASFSLYHVLPATAAFAILIVIVGLSSSLAIMQNALSLALFGIIGGFLAPILTSTGSNNYIGLFSFYAVLNAGIFAIAWFKAWKILNLVGFTFTFSISSFWGMSSYQPENFSSIEPFLILFFLFYVGIAILYASRKAPDFKDYVDGTLIFGTPIVAFGMQAAMVNHYEYGVAISAFVMGVFYLLLAYWCWKKFAEELRFLTETLLAVAVIFATLAIPFAVDGSTTSAAWAMEATGILWVSIRQQQHFRRLFALVLQLFAGFALLGDATQYQSSAFLNSSFIGVLIVTFCAGISSWMLYQPFTGRKDYEAKLSPWVLAYSLIWLFAGYEYQIESHQALSSYHGNLILFLTILCNITLASLALRLAWSTANKVALWMMLPLLFVSSLMVTESGLPFDQFGAVLWPLAIISYFFNLKIIKNISESLKLNLHLLTTFLIYFLLFWEGTWQVLLGASLLTILFYYCYRRFQWSQMRECALSLLPLMLFLTLLCLFSKNMHPFELADIAIDVNSSFEAGYLLWPFAFAVLYGVFYQCDKVEAQTLPGFHLVSLLLLQLLPTWEASWHLSNYLPLLNGWHIALFPLTTILALWLIMQAKTWPFKQYQDSFYQQANPILIFTLFVWTLISFGSAVLAAPIPWIPFINPAEIVQAIIFISVIQVISVSPENSLSKQEKLTTYITIASFIFIWLNVVLLRTIHHWGGYTWEASLWLTAVTQTCLSIFWTLTGLGLAVLATRKQSRKLWIVGAVLLVIVVFKLLLFDMSSHDSIERIISFIGVGILLMLIGYFAPLPPAENENEVANV